MQVFEDSFIFAWKCWKIRAVYLDFWILSRITEKSAKFGKYILEKTNLKSFLGMKHEVGKNRGEDVKKKGHTQLAAASKNSGFFFRSFEYGLFI